METIEPDQIPPEVPHSNQGRVGFWLSLAAPAALVLMVVLRPG